MNYFLIVLGVVIGFLCGMFFAGKSVGQKGRLQSLTFKIKQYTIHMHHWIIATVMLFVLVFTHFYNDVIVGFLLGLIVQGLTYSDFYRIATKS